jgi:transcriptional regulator with XRE-family HTH domain
MIGPWGEAIRRIREQRKWTKRRVAKTAKLSPTTYGLIERGGHTQTRKLEQIAQALEVDLVEILVPPRGMLEQEERRELARQITEDVLRALDERNRESSERQSATDEKPVEEKADEKPVEEKGETARKRRRFHTRHSARDRQRKDHRPE